jgi:hypothetical protein
MSAKAEMFKHTKAVSDSPAERATMPNAAPMITVEGTYLIMALDGLRLVFRNSTSTCDTETATKTIAAPVIPIVTT